MNRELYDLAGDIAKLMRYGQRFYDTWDVINKYLIKTRGVSVASLSFTDPESYAVALVNETEEYTDANGNTNVRYPSALRSKFEECLKYALNMPMIVDDDATP